MERLMIRTGSAQYPVIVGANILDRLSDSLIESGIKKGTKILIISDQHVADLYLDRLIRALEAFDIFTYVVDSGERSKSLYQTEKIVEFAIKNGLNRSSAVLAFGGGVIGDLAGFISAIYMRGIKFLQVPTTILAHDSSVGGKVAVNHALGKNLIGAFHQPELVFYNTEFLLTLPEREIRSGLAELIKHGLIADQEFSHTLYAKAEDLLKLELEVLNKALITGISIKAEIVKDDEREEGVRALLNYGHTLAHAVETISDFTFSHGEAVALGMVFAARLSHQLGLAKEEVVDFTLKLMEKFCLPTEIPNNFAPKDMLEILMRDKKFKTNNIRMVLPTDIGTVIINENIDKKLLLDLMYKMKNK